MALLLYWMSRSRLTTASWIVLSIGLLANVSFFLFCRQCRYYSLAFLLSLVIAYLYLNWNGRLSGIIGIMLASILLLLTHYLPYAGLYAVLACDCLLFAPPAAAEAWPVVPASWSATTCGHDHRVDLQPGWGRGGAGYCLNET